MQYAKQEGKLAYEYEELVKANLPQLCELFVFRFRLFQIERPDCSGWLIILTVWVPIVCIWTLVCVLWLKVLVF